MVSNSLQKLVTFLRFSELTTTVVEDTPSKISGIENPPTSSPETISQIPQEEKTHNRSATLLLFPDTVKSSFWLAQEKCSPELQHNTMELPTETCLSGDYELSSNLMISSTPRCSNGQPPAMILFDQQNCRGNALFQSTGPKDIPLGTCLLYQTAKEWSLVFRCSIWPELILGAEKHEIAIPPRDPEDPRKNGRSRGKSGLITYFKDNTCSSQISKPLVAADKCIQTAGGGIQISTPAICPSGKRAKLARFSDFNCDSPLEENSIIKVYDSEVGKCLETDITESNKERINSVAFHCRGIETELEDLTQAQIYTGISPPACKNVKGVRYESPKSVSVDTCVQVPFANIQINRRPTCPDGTRAKFARFADTSCEIAINEKFLVDIGDKDIGTCLEEGFTRLAPSPRHDPFTSYDRRGSSSSWPAQSIAFWCSGLGNYKHHPLSTTPASATCPVFDLRDYERRNNGYNSQRGQLVCNGHDHERLHPVAENPECPEDAGTLVFGEWQWWSREHLEVIHVLPNTCVHRENYFQRPVMVLNPGRCANGKRPLLALYPGKECDIYGMEYSETIELDADKIGTTPWNFGYYSSVALICGGPVLELNPERKYSEWEMDNIRSYWLWQGKKGVLIALWVIVGLIGLVSLVGGFVYWNVWGKVKDLAERKNWRIVFERRKGAITLD